MSRTSRRPPPKAASPRFTASGRPKRRRHAFGWFSVALRIGLVLLLLLWGLILWHRLG